MIGMFRGLHLALQAFVEFLSHFFKLFNLVSGIVTELLRVDDAGFHGKSIHLVPIEEVGHSLSLVITGLRSTQEACLRRRLLLLTKQITLC